MSAASKAESGLVFRQTRTTTTKPTQDSSRNTELCLALSTGKGNDNDSARFSVLSHSALKVNASFENVVAIPTRHRFSEMRASDTVKSKTSVQTHRTLLSKPLRSVAVKKIIPPDRLRDTKLWLALDPERDRRADKTRTFRSDPLPLSMNYSVRNVTMTVVARSLKALAGSSLGPFSAWRIVATCPPQATCSLK